jgi:hypothetical protein
MQAAIIASEGRAYLPEKLLQPDDVTAAVVSALMLRGRRHDDMPMDNDWGGSLFRRLQKSANKKSANIVNSIENI